MSWLQRCAHRCCWVLGRRSSKVGLGRLLGLGARRSLLRIRARHSVGSGCIHSGHRLLVCVNMCVSRDLGLGLGKGEKEDFTCITN
jgi:hypothetical protein